MLHKLLLLLCACLFPIIASATVTEKIEIEGNIKLKYPSVQLDNISAQNAINKDIETHINDVKYSHYHKLGHDQSALSYTIKYEDENYLSLILEPWYYSTGAIHGQYVQMGLVYNKQTGEKVPLRYFVRIKSPQQLETALNDNIVTLWSNNFSEKLSLRGNKIRHVTDSYYLGPDGDIFLIYQPYELASYAEGATRIMLTKDAVNYFNRINERKYFKNFN